MSENEISKAALLARTLVRSGVAPRKRNVPPPTPQPLPRPTRPAESFEPEEPTVTVKLTRTELRALRHSKKVRATSLSFALSQQEKETIKRHCHKRGTTVSEWIRKLAFEAMGKPIPKRPETKARGPYKKKTNG